MIDNDLPWFWNQELDKWNKKTSEITTNIKTKYLGEIKKDLLNKIRFVTSLVLQEIIKKREESLCNPSDA